jgi:hypothetical protein
VAAITFYLDDILICRVAAVIAAIVILACRHANAGIMFTFSVLCHGKTPLVDQILPHAAMSKS